MSERATGKGSAKERLSPLDREQTRSRGGSVGAGALPARCGAYDIRINRDGLWFYHGSPIGRKELVKLFASVLRRDEEGRYWLQTPAEKGEIHVEDAPFLAVELNREGSGRGQKLIFRTNLDEIVIADHDHPLRVVDDPATAEPNPYLLVRDRLEARLTRPVFYELVEHGCEQEVAGEVLYGVWSMGQFFPLGRIDEC